MAFKHNKKTGASKASKRTSSKASKRTSSKRTTSKASKRCTKKPEYIKGSLQTKNFENLTGTVTVQLTEDTNRKSKRAAWGSLVLGGCFTVYINVYEGENGYFISYPYYLDDEGNYHDLAYCFDREVIEGLTDLITEMIDGDEDDEEDEDDENDEDLPF